MAQCAHPKCYGNSTNNCSTKISGEHFISDNLLKEFEQNNTVKITGLPRVPSGSFILTSRKSLVSNILCTKHNNDLSPYDNEMGKLHRCIREFDTDFNSGSPKTEVRQFNGDYIEKWMLKTACGLIASNQIASNQVKQPLLLKEEYINILFNNGIWPEKWGMYFKIPADNLIHKFDCTGFMPFSGNGELKAGEFWINNFVFNLVLGIPDQPDAWGIYRINKIHFTDGVVRKTIEFVWDDPTFGRWIEITRVGVSSNYPANWPDYLTK